MEILSINKSSLFCKLYIILSIISIYFNSNYVLNLFIKYKSENIIDSNIIENYFKICNKEILLNKKIFKKIIHSFHSFFFLLPFFFSLLHFLCIIFRNL